MEWSRYCIFLYWFLLFVTELNLACDESELSPIQFSVNTTTTKKTDWTISTEADLTTLYVDSLNNTVLCKNLFANLIISTSKPKMWRKSKPISCLGRIKINKTKHIQQSNGDGSGATATVKILTLT
jgi:hypothetical protein